MATDRAPSATDRATRTRDRQRDRQRNRLRGRQRERQRERLRAAEAATFAQYGIDATSEPLVLADPALTTRVVRLGSGPPTVLFHGGAMTSTVCAPPGSSPPRRWRCRARGCPCRWR